MDFFNSIRDEPFNTYRGYQKMTKKLFAGGKTWKKLFANSLSGKNCLHATLKILRILKYPLVAKMPFCCN